MKKTYVKPMLSKESFSLTESVASGCGWVAGASASMTTPENCSYSVNGVTFFLDPSKSCAVIPAPEDTEVYCYNSMVSSMPVFRS